MEPHSDPNNFSILPPINLAYLDRLNWAPLAVTALRYRRPRFFTAPAAPSWFQLTTAQFFSSPGFIPELQEVVDVMHHSFETSQHLQPHQPASEFLDTVIRVGPRAIVANQRRLSYLMNRTHAGAHPRIATQTLKYMTTRTRDGSTFTTLIRLDFVQYTHLSLDTAPLNRSQASTVIGVTQSQFVIVTRAPVSLNSPSARSNYFPQAGIIPIDPAAKFTIHRLTHLFATVKRSSTNFNQVEITIESQLYDHFDTHEQLREAFLGESQI